MKNQEVCPFCYPEPESELLLENESTYAILDKFPVSNGHTLIIPQKHCANYFELNYEEQKACWSMVNKTQEIITKKFNPDGFNIGINVNETAGQTIPHVHIHLIPRYKGDVLNPEGGIRVVIPSKAIYKK